MVSVIIYLFSLCSLGTCPSFQSAVNVGTIPSVLNETSGIVSSRKNEGVLWAHNDSGAGAYVYALNTQGVLLGTFTVSGATNRDWEDIAIGPGPEPNQQYLYIGDIGGNISNYGNIKIYRVVEPNIFANQSPPINATLTTVEVFTFTYPASYGWHDAETLLIDPATKDLYIITKGNTFVGNYTLPGPARVFRAAYPYTNSVLEYKTTISSITGCTGGDISPSGTLIAVRNYNSAYIWRRDLAQEVWAAFAGTPCSVPLASESQGEAIGFAWKNRGYYTVSEGTNKPLSYYARNPLDCFEVYEMDYGLRSDFNQDCKVDVLDLMIFLDYWLSSN